VLPNGLICRSRSTRGTVHFSAAFRVRARLRISTAITRAPKVRVVWRFAASRAWRFAEIRCPPMVEEFPIRPVWQLSNVEEKRTRGVEVAYSSAFSIRERTSSITGRRVARPAGPKTLGPRLPALARPGFRFAGGSGMSSRRRAWSRPRRATGTWKTLVAATVVSDRGGPAWAVPLHLSRP